MPELDLPSAPPVPATIPELRLLLAVFRRLSGWASKTSGTLTPCPLLLLSHLQVRFLRFRRLAGLGGTSVYLFHNPHLMEQRFWSLSSYCLHWDAARAVRSEEHTSELQSLRH